MTKTCFKCGQEKDTGEFYRHAKMADGFLGKCKECTKKDARANYSDHREAYQQYELQRKLKPARKAAAAAHISDWRLRNPQKHRAHQMVMRAVRKGEIVKEPCESCGQVNRVVAHHDDYRKPLSVRWFCQRHHLAHHKTLGKMF